MGETCYKYKGQPTVVSIATVQTLPHLTVTPALTLMSSTHVAIIGAGIAGPVLAMLFKQRGYDPVVYERAKEPWQGGLSLV